jgi:hypothetical protein
MGRPRPQYLGKSPGTYEQTDIKQWKEQLATNPNGKLPTNQKIEE